MLSKYQIPWPKITAEGVAIVVSILLAFGIEAWWSDRQDQKVVEENLAALRDELNGNLQEIRHERNFRQAVIASIKKLYDLARSDGPYDSSALDSLLGDITWGGRIDVSTGALLSTLQTGVLASIDESELQRSLSSLPALYETTAHHERNSASFTNNQINMFINIHGSLLQVFNAGEGAGRPGGGGEHASDFVYPASNATDHSPILRTEEFLGYLAMSQGTHANVVLYYDRLEKATQRSIDLIEQRLD